MENYFICICKSAEVGCLYLNPMLYREDELIGQILYLNSLGVLVEKIIEVSHDRKFNLKLSNYEY